jgi:valyl-tRNA synthetase
MGFNYFYPMADLSTGTDIVFFCVARMILWGLNLLSDQEIQRPISFENVYFTNIVHDHLGRKMSKSLGNSPNPLDFIEQDGAKGVRRGLLSMATKGQDILFSEDRAAQGKRLGTKLWNSCRFHQQRGMEGDHSSLVAIAKPIDSSALEADDVAISGRLLEAMDRFEGATVDCEFSRAVPVLYICFRSGYCNWYIEISKMRASETV